MTGKWRVKGVFSKELRLPALWYFCLVSQPHCRIHLASNERALGLGDTTVEAFLRTITSFVPELSLPEWEEVQALLEVGKGECAASAISSTPFHLPCLECPLVYITLKREARLNSNQSTRPKPYQVVVEICVSYCLPVATHLDTLFFTYP